MRLDALVDYRDDFFTAEIKFSIIKSREYSQIGRII
jgi:hypothetical protein